MVSPHLKINSGSRKAGKSGIDRFHYICREGKYKKRSDKVEITHQNYPIWANDCPQNFWKAADIYERANARIYTEIEIALPRELTQTQQTKLIREFVVQELGSKHPYTIAFHCPKALDGGLNPHVHLMFSERANDGIERDEKQFFKRANSKHPERGGAAKNRDWSRRTKVAEFRNSWEKAINLAFQRAGIDKVISLKSLAEQGINRLSEPKLGARQAAMMRQGKQNDNILLVQSLRKVRNIEADLIKVQNEITKNLKDLAHEVLEKEEFLRQVKKAEKHSQEIDLSNQLQRQPPSSEELSE